MEIAMAKYCVGLVAALVISILTCGISAQEIGKRIISTPNAPAAVGPYSQAIRAGRTVYLAGQIAIDPNTNQPMSSATIEEQTRRVLLQRTA
jgi:2-iminobutanoate/2-iminopropanoate deaminase